MFLEQIAKSWFMVSVKIAWYLPVSVLGAFCAPEKVLFGTFLTQKPPWHTPIPKNSTFITAADMLWDFLDHSLSTDWEIRTDHHALSREIMSRLLTCPGWDTIYHIRTRASDFLNRHGQGILFNFWLITLWTYTWEWVSILFRQVPAPTFQNLIWRSAVPPPLASTLRWNGHQSSA